jgi:hypothetical protein
MNGQNIPDISSALAMNDTILRQKQALSDAKKRLIQLKQVIKDLFPDLNNKKIKELFDYLNDIHTPQIRFLEFEISKLERQIELQNPELSISDVSKISEDIAEKAQREREKYFETKKITVLTLEQQAKLKEMFRAIARLLHTDTNHDIDSAFITQLGEYKATDNIEMIERLYIELVEKNSDPAVVFDLIKKEPTSNDLNQDIINYQNKVTELEKFKDFLVSTRSYNSESFSEIVYDLEKELNNLRDKKAELEKQFEEILSSKEVVSIGSFLISTAQDMSEFGRSEAHLNQENKMEKDNLDWEKAKTQMSRFISDMRDGVYDFKHIDKDIYSITWAGTTTKFAFDDKARLQFFFDKKNMNGVVISLTDSLGDAYLSSMQTHFYHPKHPEKSTGTFAEVFGQIKSEIKENAGIDLDKLYGDTTISTTDMTVAAKDLATNKSENSIEKKKDIWNPTNMRETQEAVKALDGVIKTWAGIGSGRDSEGVYKLAKEGVKGQLSITISQDPKFVTLITATRGTSEFSDNEFKISEYIPSGRRNTAKKFEIICKDERVYTYTDDRTEVDECGPVTFQSIKKELKKFGLDLDNIQQTSN